MRSLNDLIRVTEGGAIAASKWVGSGNKEMADAAATEAIRNRLNKLYDFSAIIAIGEGKKDESFGLYEGEIVGSKTSENPIYEIAIDPIEGTTPTVNSGPEAISVMAVGDYNSMWKTDEFYVMKLAYGPKIFEKTKLNISDSIDVTVEKAAKALNKNIEKMTVCVLNRPRHKSIIKQLRELNVRVKLIQDCDVSGAIATCLDKTNSPKEPGIDLLYGIGGAPEAVISAAGIKCLHGDFQCQVYKKTIKENWLPLNGDYQSQLYEKITEESWEQSGDTLNLNDLIKSNCVFVATGITAGSILDGVKYTGNRVLTNSCFMRSESGTVRFEETWHGN